MSYNPPKLNELLDLANELKETDAANKTELEQIRLIKFVAGFVNKETDKEKQKELLGDMMGVFTYAMESIASEFYINSPKYQEGRIFTSGSKLHSKISQLVNPENKFTAREKLIYLTKFHKFVASNPSGNINNKKVLANVKIYLTNQLNALTAPIAQTINAIPTESSVTKHMDNLPDDYRKAKELANSNAMLFTSGTNEDRIFQTQLAKSIAHIKDEDTDNLADKNLTRSQRIKWGDVLFIEKDIASEFKYSIPFFHSPINSVLYCLSRQILNIPNNYNLSDNDQIACLLAFDNYIKDPKVREGIEKFGRDTFGDKNLLINIDKKFDEMHKTIEFMVKKLEPSFAKTLPATTSGAIAGSIIGAIAGYGVGSVTGLFLSEGSTVRPAANAVGSTLNNVATGYFGKRSSAGYYSFMFGDFIVSSVLSRGFAKLFELVGMAIGGAAGGLIGLSIDLSYQSFTKLCHAYLKYYDENPQQMRNADCELVKCLLELPPEIFTPDNQNRIIYSGGKELQPEPTNESSINYARI